VLVRLDHVAANSHRGDGKRFVVRADEKLAAYLGTTGGDSWVNLNADEGLLRT
jgi:hypothetical protein